MPGTKRRAEIYEGESYLDPPASSSPHTAPSLEPEPSTPKRQARGSEASKKAAKVRTPKTPRTPKRKKEKPARTDPSTWPPSISDSRITKGNAMCQYRLKAGDFVGMGYQTCPTDTGYMSLLYKESEVERKAWEKHGGPECWNAYLKDLRERFQKRYPGKIFSEPDPPGSSGMVTILDSTYFAVYENEYNVHPKLLSQYREVESRFPARWIFKACRKALETKYDKDNEFSYSVVRDNADELRILRKAFLPLNSNGLGFYPDRPSAPLVSSPSINRLREILDRAPVPLPGGSDEYVEGIDSIHDGLTGYIFHAWDDDYLEPLYAALIDVVYDHGTGSDGWSSARWEVYNKHAECIEGIHYVRVDEDSQCWDDGSKHWLYGKLGNMKGGKNAQLYNSRLPRLPDGQLIERY